jgi:putative SOS response-associated peptidase YedK
MCGRFARKTKPKNLAKKFKAQVKENALFEIEAKYNIAPSSLNPIFRMPAKGEQPIMESFKWGLVPQWANDPSIGFKLANARAETLSEKPSFRSAFKSRRCLVPVDGYYEWTQDTTPKQPHYFFMKDGEPFCLAGLWELWDPKEKDLPGEPLYTFTLITTEPNALCAKVHDRMPVIINEKDFEAWLDPGNQDVENLKGLLKAYPASKMDSYPVSTFVSNARNEGPQCLEKAEPPKTPAKKTKAKEKSIKPRDQMGFDL